MMRRAKFLPCVAWMLLVSCACVCAANKGKYTPGKDKSFPWKMMDINKCLESGKPVLLYVYEPIPGNNYAEELEKNVFPNQDVKAVFADFLHVRISTIDRAWPPAMVRLGAKGAAMVLMTCDGKVAYMCGKGNMPKSVKGDGKTRLYPDLVAAAKMVVERNVKAQEDVKANPPPKYVPPGQEAAVADAGKDMEEEKPKGVSGLLGGVEDGKKAEGAGCAKKEDGTKKAEAAKKVVEEDE